MAIKQSYRPGYASRRFVHHKRVDFAVWLQNRKVEKAFNDPFIEGGAPSRLTLWMGHRATPWLIGAIALIAAGTAVVFALHGRMDAASLLSGLPATPETDVAIPAAGSAGASAPASVAPPGPASAPASSPAEPPAAPSLPEAAVSSLSAAPIPAPATFVMPSEYNALVACKKDRTLYVYHRKDNEWRKVAAFPMVFGRLAGDKSDAGDWRTPEGRYWITALYPGPIKGPLYGSLVFTLNYPTPRDQAEGKTGQGIWIHGVEAGKRPNYTHGCLSLANDDMLALAGYADIGTPVLIIPDSLNADPARQMDDAGMKSEYPALMTAHARRTHEDTLSKEKALAWAKAFVDKEAKAYPQLAEQSLAKADRDNVLAALDEWRKDWIGRDVAKYGSHYAAEFHDKEGRDRAAFLTRKARIFESKNKIDMEMGRPEIESEGYGRVKVSFRQEYVAEGADGVQRSSSIKTMRMEQGPGGWQIINE